MKGYENLDTRNFQQRINSMPDLIPHFEELLEEWCNKIEEYLDADSSSSADRGPKGELEYWRNRMQRLTSITEQLKRKVSCLRR